MIERMRRRALWNSSLRATRPSGRSGPAAQSATAQVRRLDGATRRPAEYQTYIDPWINIDASNIWFDGAAGSGQWGIDDYASAGVEVSVFTIDK